MAAMYQTQADVDQIAKVFVTQYYQIIQQTPHLGYQFYSIGSTVTRVDGKNETSVTSIENIHNILSSLNYTSIEIKTVHAVSSWDAGVLVMVSGFVQMQHYSGRRQFVQTFFLAPQAKGYFVLNDIFYLLDEQTTLQPSANLLGHNSYDGGSNMANHQMQDTGLGYTVREEIQTRDYVSPVDVLEEELQAREYVAPLHTEEMDPVDNYNIPEPQQVSVVEDKLDEVPVDEPVTSFPTNVTMVQEPPPASIVEPLGERPKQTYASILRLAKGQPGNFLPRAAPVSKVTPVVSDSQLATSQQSYPSATVQLENSNLESAEEAEDDGEVKSVYVRNLSSSILAEDLEHEFKNFGDIIPNGVTVRTRKDSGGYYAFVEFEDASSVQKALQASPLLVNGRQIYVEERRPNSGLSRLGGRRGRGRGGYPSESSRGRFGGRGYGRGGVNDNSDRDYSSSRPRGNGVVPRVPRQERGILGNHATRNGAEATY